MLFFMLFGIFGTNYFKGTFFYCETSKVPSSLTNFITDKWTCIDSGGVWVNRDANFDNVLQSMVTLFEMSTTEGWVGTMWNGVDSVAIDREPEVKRNIYWVFFFMAFIIVGSQFLMNLFVGVVINSFNNEREKLGKNHLLSDRQREWIKIQELCLKTKPVRKIRPGSAEDERNTGLVRSICLSITEHWLFDSFILVCIMVNTVVLALKWYGEPEALPSILEVINYVFAAIFTVEAGIKLIALRNVYFYDGWNVFDFAIVIGTYIGITISATTNVSVGPQTTIIRSFRILRILRLIKKARSLQMIFNAFVITIPSLANVGGLLFLLLYLYAILGVFSFATVQLQE